MSTVNFPTNVAGIQYANPAITSLSTGLAVIQQSGISLEATPAYSLGGSLVDLNLLNSLSPTEFDYLTNMNGQSSSVSSTSANNHAATHETDNSNPANPFGDPIDAQVGDSALYAMDPSLQAAQNDSSWFEDLDASLTNDSTDAGNQVDVSG